MDKKKILELAQMTEKMAQASLLGVESILKESGLDKNKDLATSLLVNTYVLALALAVEAKSRGILVSDLFKLDTGEYSAAFEDANRIAKFVFDEILSKKNSNITLVEMKVEEEKEDA